ncbi:GAF domain-containing protein [Nocardioidaceae bacterium]|nr:GAF domain-containing protein [Nocardioidaceae bacterium]
MTTAPDATLFADMARILESSPDVASTASRICEIARDAIRCEHAGITLLHGRRRLETIAVTDELVRTADALQQEMNEGPCLQAIWGHDTLVAEDLSTEERWPVWGPKVAELGISAILSVRLFTHSETHGALNLYASGTRPSAPTTSRWPRSTGRTPRSRSPRPGRASSCVQRSTPAT